MCCSKIPGLPQEANKARCFVIACFVFSILSMLNFAVGVAGFVGAIAGILACVASSMLMCCLTPNERGGKFLASGILLLLAGIIQFAVAIWLIVVLNENLVDLDGYCEERYKDCTTQYDGQSCTDGAISGVDTSGNLRKYTDGLCYHCQAGDILCVEDEPYCTSKVSQDNCEALHGVGEAAINGMLIIVFGITIAFDVIAAVLNLIGGIFCLQARAAIAKASQSPVGIVTRSKI